MNNLEKFVINPTNEFHVLRHFKFVDHAYKETLIGVPYWYYDYSQKKFVYSTITKANIENALNTISTKFDKNIVGIENPKKLLELVKNKYQELLSADEILWIDHSEFKTAIFGFNYQYLVGKKNCLNMDDLSEKERVQIKHIPRSKCVGEDEIIVNTISGIELSSTKTIHIQIVETKQLPFYSITAYPDCSLSDEVPDDKLVFVV